MILNQAQAKAVYDAICALNNVNALLKASFGELSGSFIGACSFEDGAVRVWSGSQFRTSRNENFTTQDDFVKAYEL